jgi:putative ABC transport system substrate-binding protein
MNSRRRPMILAATALLAMPACVFSQTAGKQYHVGVLLPSIPSADEPVWNAFITELKRRGYSEGRNLVLHLRAAGKDGQDLERQAIELVSLKVDVLVASAGSPSVQAAKIATSSIPIVMFTSAEPVRDGLVDSLARPGGNVTGNSVIGLELLVKRLQLIAEVVGKPDRIAYVGSRRSAAMRHFDEYQAALNAAAKSIDVELHTFMVNSIEDLQQEFDDIAKQHIGAVVIDNPAIFYANLERIAGLAARYRLPAIAEGREYAVAGLLITYGPDYLDLSRRTAAYVDRILRGGDPRDLPVEQPTKFEMVVNMKTAAELGVRVPRRIMLQATEAIR